MPKYLFQTSYTVEGAKGLLKDGGTKRRKVTEALFKSLGGRMEAYYFAFGENDAFVIGELPDNVSATSAALTVIAGGGSTVKTTVLLTPEEVDAAVKKTPGYTPPGR
jgi:uncharacterized protein with GYD domain